MAAAHRDGACSGLHHPSASGHGPCVLPCVLLPKFRHAAQFRFLPFQQPRALLRPGTARGGAGAVCAPLIKTAPFPLLGLALLQIAAELGPHDPLLKSRARLCSQLAVAAALGFLLLLPLQTVAGLQQGRSLNQAQAARIQGAEAKLKALHQAVAGAASNADLNQQLQKLEGPALGPADIAQPLPLL